MVKAINQAGVEITTSRKQAVRYGMRITGRYAESAILAREINQVTESDIVQDLRRVPRALLRRYRAELGQIRAMYRD